MFVPPTSGDKVKALPSPMDAQAKGECDMKNLTKQQILDGFVRICKTGTSKDCRIYVQEAKQLGITYDELCDYKKEVEERK